MSNAEMDPFVVLNLPPTADKHEIKRTYKRMALKYHPDVLTDRNASAEERKRANDAFAKINWAYAQLSCTDKVSSKTSSTSTSTGGSSSRPPGRRTSKLYSDYPNQQASTAYHAGDDSFVSLEDLFESAAIGAARAAWGGGGGSRESRLWNHDNPNHAPSNWLDYVSLVEGDIIGTQGVAGGADGISHGIVHAREKEEDAQLQILLKTGSAKQVGMEMDDTD
jgi:curved DNA-binding protein CbpA